MSTSTSTNSNVTSTWKVPSTSSALFCPDCGSILALPTEDNISACYDCPYKVENLSVIQVQRKKYTTDDDGKHVHANPTMRRATVEEPCPKCEYPQLRFYTMQMRSVDEGQTVFYECEKCGHTYSTNT